MENHNFECDFAKITFFSFLISLIPTGTSTTPTLHGTLERASCFISDQVLFRSLLSLSTVCLHVSQGLIFFLPIPSRGLHCIVCRVTEDSSFLFAGYAHPTPFVPFNGHINQLHIIHFPYIHIRCNTRPIKLKNASEASVYKDLKFGAVWFGWRLSKF